MNLTNNEDAIKLDKKKSIKKQIVFLLGVSLVIIFITLIILFIIIRNISGSPYKMPLDEISSEYTIYHWGLDKTPFQQFFIFLWNIISGNWGESIFISNGVYVWTMIISVLPRSLELNFLTFIFSLPLGVLFGIWAFKFKDKWKGRISKAIKRLYWAIFILGLGIWLVYTFGYKLNWLPSCGRYDPNLPDIPKITHFRLLDCLLTGDFVAFWDRILHLIMPVFCLSFIMISFISEMTYSIIDFNKSPKELHYLSGKIGFYLSFIFNSNMILEFTFCTNAMGTLAAQSMHSGDVFLASAAFYCILLTFIIINISINILVYIVPIIMERVKKSKMTKDKTDSTTTSELPVSESISDSLEIISEPIVEKNPLALENSDDNEKTISKDKFKRIKSKSLNPLTIIGIILVLIILTIAIFTKWIAPYDYELITGTDVSVDAYLPPSSENIFGIGKYGRDVYSRCLYGIKTAVNVGFFSTMIGMPLGVFIGSISAFYGKWVKFVIDTINGFILLVPGFLFAYSMILIVGNDIRNYYWILGLIGLPISSLFSQQAITYEMKKGGIIPREFTKSNGRKFLKRLPNILLSILGIGFLIIGLSILIFEILNFLGIGDYSIIALGADINIARSRMISAFWASIWPAVWIFITVLGFIMLGSGLKEEE